MARPNVSSALLEILTELGVKYVFGIPGDAINGLLEEIRKQDAIEFVHVRHEEAGAFAAVGHAKLTGTLGVCVGTSGPGAIHLLNPLYDAKLDRVPVLAITGQVETAKLGTRYHQEVDLGTLFKDVAAFNETVVNPEQMPGLAVHACQTALARGAVAHLSLPADIATAPIPEPDRHRVFGGAAETTPCAADVEAAARLLNGAGRVTILAGIGVSGAAPELVEAAQILAAPIVKTLRAKDIIPDEHPHAVGGLGLLGTRPAVHAVEGCDALLMVGTDFPYEDFYPKGAKAVQIDLDPHSLGRRYPVDVGVLGHAHLALRELTARLTPKTDRAFLTSAQEGMRKWWAAADKLESDDAVPIRPQRVAATVGRLADDDALFLCDTGTVTVWGARHLRVRGTQRFTLSSSLASMAFALPAAVGAQLAFPKRQVIALCGDGGFTMLMADFLTAADRGLPLTAVVFNNSKLGLIQMEQEAQGFPEYQTSLRNPDFAEFARLCGGEGFTVTEPADLEPTLREALGSDRPVVVDVHVNPTEVTMPPKVMSRFALGYAMAKAKETLGRGDRDRGLAPLTDALSPEHRGKGRSEH